MALSFLSKIFNAGSTKIYTAHIILLSNNGRHIISTGRPAPVLTDERLKQGDQVIVIEDENDRPFILGGSR